MLMYQTLFFCKAHIHNIKRNVRNILILELPGTKEGEMELRKIYEELRSRGYKCKLMN